LDVLGFEYGAEGPDATILPGAELDAQSAPEKRRPGVARVNLHGEVPVRKQSGVQFILGFSQ
jgi:hypothetical protein